MTVQQFFAYVRLKTKTNATTFPDASLLLLMNIYKDEMAGKLVDIVDEDYFGMPQTHDMINGQREYPLAGDLPGKIKKVECVIDPTYLDVNGNPVWIDLKKFDLTQLSQLAGNMVVGDAENGDLGFAATTNEDNIRSLFGNREGEASFMIYRNSIWIFSGELANFVPGNNYLKVWGYTWPQDITDPNSLLDLSQDPSNTSNGIPRQVHLPWADKVVLAWKQTSDKSYQPDDYEAATDKRAHEALMSLTPVDKSESFTATQPLGGQLWRNGSDL